MIKLFAPKTCAFDAEWIPSPDTARRLLDLPAATDDATAIHAVWQHYATADEPRPFLKLVLSKVVTIAAVLREVRADNSIHLQLYAQSSPPKPEGEMICDFLETVAEGKYQLWGYNSNGADIPILKQRALVSGIPCPLFSKRPNKPWEGIDYHDRNSDWNMDIMQLIGGSGRMTPKLGELAVACGLPGKLDISGDQVADLYLTNELPLVLEYNCTDAVTTHLLMLQIAHHSGHLSAEQYKMELAAVQRLVTEQIDEGSIQFEKFLATWLPKDARITTTQPARSAPVIAEVKATPPTSSDFDWTALTHTIKAKLGVQIWASLNSAKQRTIVGSTVTIYFAENKFAYDKVCENRDQLTELMATEMARPDLCLECRLGKP